MINSHNPINCSFDSTAFGSYLIDNFMGKYGRDGKVWEFSNSKAIGRDVGLWPLALG